MSIAVNYSDVINQLESSGLDVSQFAVGSPRPVRCRVDGEKGRKGWYWLHEMPFDSGDIVIVGSYGVWHGNDNGAQKIEIPKASHATKEDNALIRKRIMATKKKLAEQLKREHAKSALKSLQKWRVLDKDGESGYTKRKQVKPFGVRFTGDGALVVPMMDTSGKVHGLQFILDKSNPAHQPRIKKMGTDKRFWPTGLAMTGHFHIIGAPDPTGIMLITEGYATGASLHMATGLPVIVVFSANNILPVLQSLEQYHKRARFLICADDDYLCRCQHCKKQTVQADSNCAHCGKAHGKINTGVNVAMKAAMSVDRAAWIVPQFTDRTDPKTGKPFKLTDFNDLHCSESLQSVESQLSAAIADKFPAHGKAQPPAREPRTGGAGDSTLRLLNADEVVERYSLIYGPKDTMFDRALHKLVPKSCVLDNTMGRGWDDIKHHPDLKRVDIDAVGFDASEQDDRIIENMYTGWQTEPKRGHCEKLLELAEYMCSGDKNSSDVFGHMMKWLAYPIQHPGAKMKSALVLHGPTRVGKNLFFEAVMQCYGDYGLVIGQSELEDKFNDWASRKLFLIANEIVARQDLFHQKNKIKALVTDTTLRINPKGVASHQEKNQMNVVFLSNESQPVVPDPDDERFMIIWTPPRKDKQFYMDVLAEIENGGIEALHYHLRYEVDLGDFHPGTPPPMTLAKKDLVNLSKDSVQRFFEDWRDGHTQYPFCLCIKADLYEAYRRWCVLEGERFPRSQIQFSNAISRFDGIKSDVKPIYRGMAQALIDVPPADATKVKTARLYDIDTGDIGNGSPILERTKSAVRFQSSLKQGDFNDDDF